jgi:hypothetical protein
MELIKTKSYIIKLMNAVNLYLFIWSIGNSDFNNWEKNEKKNFSSFMLLTELNFIYLEGIKLKN